VGDHVEQCAEDPRAGLLEVLPGASSDAYSSIVGNVSTIERSWRSPAITTSTIPFSTIGSCTLKIASSASVYSSRVANPDPVETRQRASLSHGWITDRFSSATILPFEPAITRSRSSRGGGRSSASFGSMTILSASAAVDFPLPCSPWSASTGSGPVGRSVITSQLTINRKSCSVAWFRNGRSSSSDPPRTGVGSGNIPRARLKRTGGFVATSQPLPGAMATVRHSGSATSR
jgi:hypothetical protein